MTPTERATNLIQRIERLFERATKGPWDLCDKGDYCDFDGNSRVICGDDRRICAVHVSDAETNANASLIVTLRNVGLEGTVGPIKRMLELIQFYEVRTRPGILPHIEDAISKWCDVWEPELDREEGRK